MAAGTYGRGWYERPCTGHWIRTGSAGHGDEIGTPGWYAVIPGPGASSGAPYDDGGQSWTCGAGWKPPDVLWGTVVVEAAWYCIRRDGDGRRPRPGDPDGPGPAAAVTEQWRGPTRCDGGN